MPIEFDDTGLRIIGHKVKAIQFYDPGRTLRQEIYLQEDNELNIGDTGLEGQGTAATGGMVAHILSGAYHTGTLSSAQAPQFLLTDGVRNLTGDLLVSGTTEIQFYDTALAIYSSTNGQLDLKADTEIELTATTVDVQGNLDVSNGLDVTGNITVTGLVDTVDIQNHSARHDPGGADALTTAAPGSITPDASAAEGDAASFARSNHTHGITCAAPSTNLSVSSTNAEGAGTSFSRSTHSHAITTSANPGANARILATDAAGKIQLVGLGVGTSATNAAVDILETSLDHLRFNRAVGTNYTKWAMSSDTLLETDIHNEAADVYWRIYNESNDPQTSYRVFVGLNCNGDPQFDLDIAGNLRCQGWIVGKHAIQLEGALAIFHYDGPEPFETNYAGTCTGHMGQVGTTSGGVIFRPGKFQKGVQIAEATTNLCRNPSYELTGEWANVTGCTLSQSSLGVVYGDYSLKVVHAATNDRFQDVVTADTSAATQYTFSVYASGDSGGEEIKLTFYDDVTGYQYGDLIALTTTPTRYTITKTFGVASTSRTVGIISVDSGSITVYYDGFQLEQKAYATSYADGSLGLIADGAWRDGEPGTEGHYWNGTAHASTSSRIAATLKYGISGNINANEGTVGGWFYIDSYNPSGGFVWCAGDVNAELDSYIDATGNLRFRVNDQYLIHHTTVTKSTWHHIVCTWNSADNEMEVYLDGVASTNSQTPTTTPPTLGTYIGVGYSPPAGIGYLFNGFIDEFFVTDNAMDGDEVRAIYESEAPVFAESSTFQFSAGPSQLVWADHEGLWVRNDSGESVFGVFAGTGTKSWGSKTLGIGDVLFGDATGAGNRAWMQWDDSAGDLLFGTEATTRITVDGSAGTVSVGDTSNEHVYITGTAVQIKDGGSVYTDLTAGTLTLGLISGESFLEVSSTGLKAIVQPGGLNPKTRIHIQTDGDVLIGSDISAAATTNIAIFSTDQTYNSESVYAGDLIIGDNTASKANIFWDKSTGKLEFRGGTTTQACVDTDGSIKAGAGVVTLNADGLSIDVSTTASQVRSYSFLQSGNEVARVSHHVSGVSSVFIAEALAVAGLPSVAYITAAAPTGEEAEAVLWAYGGGTSAQDCLVRCNARADTSPFSCVDIYADDVYIWEAYGDANLRVGGGIFAGYTGGAPPEAITINHDGKLAWGYSAGAPNTSLHKIHVNASGPMQFEWTPSTGTTYEAFAFYGSATSGNPDRHLVSILSGGSVGIRTKTQFGSGVGVLGIANAATNPSANPTGGGVLYADAGAGKWRGSGGTTTTFGPAEPHCPVCGRDFVMEWENSETGHLIVCMWCLSEELGVREYITRKH